MQGLYIYNIKIQKRLIMRTIASLAVVCLASVSALSTAENDLEAKFVMWAIQHNKSYETI